MQTVFAIDTWPRHTRAVIDTELSKLSNLIDLVPLLFGIYDTNREAVRAQIEVIEWEMDREQVEAEFDSDFSDSYVASAAFDATAWLYEGGPAPSEDWLCMMSNDAGMHSTN